MLRDELSGVTTKVPTAAVAAAVAVVLIGGLSAALLSGAGGASTPASPRRAATSPSLGALIAPSTVPAPQVAPQFGPTGPPAFPSSVVAHANKPAIDVFPSPDGGDPDRTLENPQPSGAPLVFLVREQQPAWLQVLLPIRPNGSIGWVRRSDVTLSGHDFDIVVEIAAHRVTVFQSSQIILQEPVGLGRANTPTPGGVYYVKELLRPPNPNSVYGTYAYGLSGFSNALSSFEGGEGVIGLHGTNEPAGLGKDVSAGCIRMSNAGITRLAAMLPLGVPVEIRP